MVHVDACIEDVAKDDPLLVCLTGDAARVSFRGAIITTCGAKEVDRRLPSQMGTGKVMNQSRNTHTPMLAGYVSENVLAPARPRPAARGRRRARAGRPDQEGGNGKPH
jgi:hypothetical protein